MCKAPSRRHPSHEVGVALILLVGGWLATTNSPAASAPRLPAAAEFQNHIRPILENYCFDCHGDGAHKGNVAFDEFKSDEAILSNRDLWWRALKNLRAGIMPPAKKPRPSPSEQQQIVHWIKYDVFAIDPQNPDPGRVTLRRLNRVEYRNTVRDLVGIEYNTQEEFPPDDTGYGFDTIGNVLTLPPMLLEKYLLAAQKIISEALPDGKTGRSEALRRYFSNPVPEAAAERRARARQVLADFTRRAFRRPVDDETINRLVALAEQSYSQPGNSFESGLGQAMVAVLSSPRFLFRDEEAMVTGGPSAKPHPPGTSTSPKSASIPATNCTPADYPLVDEYALASRLSYFLWSSMPDDELLRLAGEGRLRENLDAQLRRMLADKKSRALVRNFTGQWLKLRDIDNIQIETRAVLERDRGVNPEMEEMRRRYHHLEEDQEQLSSAERAEMAQIRSTFFKRFGRPLRPGLSGEMRHSMREETERVFSYIFHEDRPLLELVDSDYTFLDQRLAEQYGITNVTGDDMRLVALPPDSARGGVLTDASVLVVTSNPTRTSPVKRGLFILDSFLGTPPPPPPANIPPLEDAAKGLANHSPTLRETLAAHRQSPLCASCHNRLDPLGLAMENFNALGMWRDSEFAQPVEAGGTLLTGEHFSSFKELKRILAQKHAQDFYRTLTEKMLTYALGRGLEYYDVETVDQIVSRIEQTGGRASALLAGITESAPFQKCQPRASEHASAGPAHSFSVAQVGGEKPSSLSQLIK